MEFAVWCKDLKPSALWQSGGWQGVGGGSEFQEGGDICIPITDSCWGMAETNTILQGNYSSIKNKLINKSNRYIWPLLYWGRLPLCQFSGEVFFFFLNHKWLLYFIESFLCIYWDDHMIFVLHFVNMVHHLGQLANAEESLHP